MKAKPERIIFESIGEVSKDIMATAVVSAIKREYPKTPIIVSTLNPEVWLHNPDVFRVYKVDIAPYFYDNYVADGKSLMFKLDPYNSDEFITGGMHLIDAWCAICGIERKKAQPQLFFTSREKAVVKKILASDKPICLIQANGEPGGLPYPIPWSRDLDLPQAEDISRQMQEKGFDVIQIAPIQDKVIQNARPVVLDNRLLMAALPLAQKRIFIDSFPQHAAAALGLPSVVIFKTMTAKRHGHSIHTNMEANESAYARELRETYIEQFRVFKMLPADVPTIGPDKLHNTGEIMSALEKLHPTKK